MDLTLPIDTLEAKDLTVQHFRTEYLKKQRPLIIKNFSKQFPAGKKWTLDYFKNYIGNHEVGLFDNAIKTNTAYVKPDLTMPFSEFIDIIKKDEETTLRMFLFDMFKEFPELRKDFPTPDIVKGILGNIGFAFFGGKNTTVRFHYDIDASSVLMTQFIGRKRVILIAPEYEDLIYKVPYASFSLIDVEQPDYDEFPGLKYVKGYDFILEPGDSLFMPSRYWHFNTYLEGGMAVAYRSIANNANDLYHGIMNTSVRILLDKSMNKWKKDNWMESKRKKAYENANRKIKKLETTGTR
jgi:ribosomal protein L16 Arg81 hydroxylase